MSNLNNWKAAQSGQSGRTAERQPGEEIITIDEAGIVRAQKATVLATPEVEGPCVAEPSPASPAAPVGGTLAVEILASAIHDALRDEAFGPGGQERQDLARRLARRCASGFKLASPTRTDAETPVTPTDD